VRLQLISSVLRRAAQSLTFGILLAAGSAWASDPFGVAPSMHSSNTLQVVEVRFTVPTGHVLYADKLGFAFGTNQLTATFELPESTSLHDKFSGEQKRVYAGSFVARHATSALTSQPLRLTVKWQGCDEANCYFPQTRKFQLEPGQPALELAEAEPATPGATEHAAWRGLADQFKVRNRASGFLNEKAFLQFLRADSADRESSALDFDSVRAVLLSLVLILAGGLALNLTPCVLPMIPINLAIIGAGTKAGSRREGFALGGVYGLAMAMAYGGLGLAVVLTGARFGSLNASPWFNGLIAAVFLVLSLAMFDRLNIDLSRFQRSPGADSSKRNRYWVAYGMGTVAALLGGACVAPVVISVLVQSASLYAQGNQLGLALPFVLGIGMALPWPFAGAGLSFLPKPGRWMIRVKYGFGVIMILFALYYGKEARGLVQAKGELQDRALGSNRAAVSGPGLDGQLSIVLERAIRERRPVFVDFWATWCKSCLAMEHSTFRRPEVKTALESFVVVKLQAEDPNASPASDLLDYFGALGMPTYLVLEPGPALANVAPRRGIPDGSVSLHEPEKPSQGFKASRDGVCPILERFEFMGIPSGFMVPMRAR
jgi:thiol:disulfide interchange protein